MKLTKVVAILGLSSVLLLGLSTPLSQAQESSKESSNKGLQCPPNGKIESTVKSTLVGGREVVDKVILYCDEEGTKKIDFELDNGDTANLRYDKQKTNLCEPSLAMYPNTHPKEYLISVAKKALGIECE